MFDYVDLVLKRNNQEFSLKNDGCKDGYVIDVIDYNEQVENFTISDFMHGPFVIVRCPIQHKAKLREGMLAIGERDTPEYRKKSLYIDFKEIEQALGREYLVADCKTDQRIETLDGSLLNLNELLKSTSELNFEKTLNDILATSSGTKTVGSGGDFATFVLADADVIALTGNLFLNMVSSTVENALIQFSAGNNNFTNDIGSNSPMNGDVTAGYSVTQNASTDVFNFASVATPGHFKIHDFKIICGASGTTKPIYMFIGTTGDVYNMYIDRGGFSSGQPSIQLAFPTDVYNNVVYNSGGGSGAGVLIGVGANNSNIYNNFITDAERAVQVSVDCTVRSNILFNSRVVDYFVAAGSVTAENNADSDSSLPASGGNKLGLTPASECDLTTTNPTFGHPLSGAVNVAAGGNATHQSANDATNSTAWPGDGVLDSIGAIQWPQGGLGNLVNGGLTGTELINGSLVG